MSVNQSKGNNNDSQQYRRSGRSGNSAPQRNFSGGGGGGKGGGGGSTTAPPSSSFNSGKSLRGETEETEINTKRGVVMGYAQLVIGPAGSGKSTYCSSLYQHCETTRITIHIVNLDPAAENFDYPVAIDIRELISVDDVMEEYGLGPNGALMYCMEHLEENLDEWLTEELENYMEDDYIVFDCPGQIELFSHVPAFKNFVEHLQRKNFNVCAVYLLDSQFITDVTKFISGCMSSLSAMIQLELPHVNILSKMDLVTRKRDIEDYLNPEPTTLLAELNQRMSYIYILIFDSVNCCHQVCALILFALHH